jgi:hypothetical protein
MSPIPVTAIGRVIELEMARMVERNAGTGRRSSSEWFQKQHLERRRPYTPVQLRQHALPELAAQDCIPWGAEVYGDTGP